MIQLQAINSLLSTKNYSWLKVNQIDESYFSDYRDEFEFISNHIKEFNKVPDPISFGAKFPDFDFIEVHETEKYIVDELYRDKNKRQLAKVFNQVRDYINDGKVDEAVSLYTNAASNIAKPSYVQAINLVADTSRYEKYIERTQDHGKYRVTTGFAELDEAIGGWDRLEELATIVARPGVGKCLAKGTQILMADGTLKNVENIKVGDTIQSLNRTNTVLALHSGRSKGYKIIPKLGEPFIVSENHILTLMRRNHVLRRGNVLPTTDNTFTLEDIMIEDYLALKPSVQQMYQLYRPSIDYCTKDQKIPPYILGLWLGDGTSCRVSLTNFDKEVIDEWCDWGKSIGYDNIRSDRGTYDITHKHKGGKPSVALDMFREHDLINNKHIPLNYLTGDRNQRLELLAGILDTDGHLSKNYRAKSDTYNYLFSISLKSKTLINQIAQLARGLGFRVGRLKEYFIDNKIKGSTAYYLLSIGGDLSQIPCRIPRKKAGKSTSHRKLSLTNFSIEEIPDIEYYGFMADGDQRYLLSDNTLTHNTFLLLKSAAAAAKTGLTVGIYSGEMTELKVGYRLDTLLGNISGSSLLRGNTDIQNSYKVHIDNLRNFVKGDIWVTTPYLIGHTPTVSDLESFIDKYNLDILFVDQHSLLADERKARDPVTKAANISTDLKALQTMKQIPIIAVSQQNRTAVEENGIIDVSHIAQSDKIGQDSTTVLAIEKKDNVMTIHLAKCRDGVIGSYGNKLKYAVDLDKGVFSFIPNEDDALGGNHCDELRDEYEFTEDYGENAF